MFIYGFNGCCSTVSSKKRYLQNKGAKGVSVDEQVNTVLCHFLEQNNMGVADTDTTEKASCESAVGRVVQSFLFLRKNLGSLLVKNSSTINSNIVLKYLQSLVPTKVHDVGVKPKSTTVDELMSFLDSIEIQTKLNKRCWPWSFFKPLQSDKSKNHQAAHCLIGSGYCGPCIQNKTADQ